MDRLINLLDLDLGEMETMVQSMGASRFRAKQIADWIFKKGVSSITEMTNLPRDFQQQLAAKALINRSKIQTTQTSSDGTAKYLFELLDGNTVESVFLKYNYGNTVCISTQVGCKMGCCFCASTIGGFQRQLSAGEIYDQVLSIEQSAGHRVGGIVLMGSGEPLDNYDEVVKFIRVISAPYSLNIGQRHITLSTSGIVPNIYRLAEEELSITLSVSLHAPNDSIRDHLMPVNKRYPLAQLIPACRDYANRTGRRVSFEYILIHGVNDSVQQAEELADLIKGLMGHVNLIPVNPVKERAWKRPPSETIKKFQTVLEKRGIPATVRREMGTEIDAACGQLRRKYSLAAKTGGK